MQARPSPTGHQLLNGLLSSKFFLHSWLMSSLTGPCAEMKLHLNGDNILCGLHEIVTLIRLFLCHLRWRIRHMRDFVLQLCPFSLTPQNGESLCCGGEGADVKALSDKLEAPHLGCVLSSPCEAVLLSWLMGWDIPKEHLFCSLLRPLARQDRVMHIGVLISPSITPFIFCSVFFRWQAGQDWFLASGSLRL